MLKLRPLKPLPILLGAALLLGASAVDVHARPARSSTSGDRAVFSRILDLGPVQAVRDLFSSVWGKIGSQLDPSGRNGDTGVELDPNGSHSTGDNGSQLDPNG
jgi:hypothetical protein